jgi:O-acetyl-ADP-ribose deacetylase (regulator of RNase III)
MRFGLRDRNPAVVDAWHESFDGAADVSIASGDIFDQPADAIVSPANSFGFMDGGIDLVYSLRFGREIERRLRVLLEAEHDGELPVGQAVIIETGDPRYPYLISAPTMRVPTDVSKTVNAYLAFRAVIRAAREFNRHAATPIETVLCPGLGTAIGRMDPRASARQMYHAYRTSHLGEPPHLPDLMAASRLQFHLVEGMAFRAR